MDPMANRIDSRVALRPRGRGFTLIELMIVVAIVGILAVLGVVGYRKLILAAHTSEATHMVQSIRTAEEAYHAEAQTYISTVPIAQVTSPTPGGTSWFPNAAPANKVTPWAPSTTTACTSAGTLGCWASLPVHADGPVSYGYAVSAGTAGNAMGPISLPNWSNLMPAVTPSTDWYIVVAMGNPANLPLTGSGPFSWVVGTSQASQLWVLDQ